MECITWSTHRSRESDDMNYVSKSHPPPEYTLVLLPLLAVFSSRRSPCDALASAEYCACRWTNLWLCLSEPGLRLPWSCGCRASLPFFPPKTGKKYTIWNGRRVLMAGDVNAGQLKTKIHCGDRVLRHGVLFSPRCGLWYTFVCEVKWLMSGCTLQKRWAATWLSLIPSGRVFLNHHTLTSQPARVLSFFLKEGWWFRTFSEKSGEIIRDLENTQCKK